MITTACPLDCWDACGITVDPAYPDKLVPTPTHPLHNGALCALLNKHFHQAPRITQPRVDGKVVSMDAALDAAAQALQSPSPLLWRGSGNLGVMQSVTDLLMERLGGTLTRGGLCDEAGGAGVESARGYNRMLPPEQIAHAEVVVVWGRNLTVTNKHLLPFIEGKKLIVIDPVRTPIAKRADLFLQIRPRTDFYLAMMLARFVMMEGGEDQAWLEKHAPDWEEFYEFTQDFRIKNILRHIDVSLDTMGDMLHLIQNHRTVFLVGIGPQHYTIGDAVLWAIDSLAAVLGLFGREGCGVSYMGNSRQGYDDPFEVSCDRVSMATTPFERFETVLVQGGNPAASMPQSNRVEASLSEVKNLIYFGLYESETSALARIVIPAKSFLEKEDLRTSYGHHCVEPMHKVLEGESGISEYDFAQAMVERLGLEALQSEEAYLSRWHDQYDKVAAHGRSPDYQAVPYAEGFGEEGGETFVFIDDFEDDDAPQALRTFAQNNEEMFDGHYWLLTPKGLHTLNTQFEGRSLVHVPPEANLREGVSVRIVSQVGELVLSVHVNEDVRHDCVMIPIGTPGVNRLTPSVVSNEGEGACYGEAKVRLVSL